MKLSCECGQDYVYDHTKAGQQFKCQWCGQIRVMPQLAALSSEDQAFYCNELEKKRAKEKRAADKQAAKIAKQQQVELERKRRAEELRIQQLQKAEEDRRYAEAVTFALSEPNEPKTWHCLINGTAHGPMQEAMVQKWIDAGRFGKDDLVRVEDSTVWIHATDIPERFHFPVSVENVVRCPKCECVQFSSNRRGIDAGRVFVGGVLLLPLLVFGSCLFGPLAWLLYLLLVVLCGMWGSDRLVLTCLNCGYRWKRGR